MRSKRSAACAGGVLIMLLAGCGSGASPSPSDSTSLTGPELSLSQVLDPLASDAPIPTQAGLQAALAPLLAEGDLGPSPAVVVMDARSGQVLLDQSGSGPVLPASTNKLVTAASVLTAYGADATIATRSVKGSGPSEVVLVGGGDPALKIAEPKPTSPPSASLAALAQETARAIADPASGITQPVTVNYDDSLFTGPTRGPGWASGYPVPAITALMADGGLKGSAAPSAAAAQAFAQQLSVHGIKVTGTAPAAASGGGAQLAVVQSPPMADLVQRTLTPSDNVASEVLAHLAGVKRGMGGSFEGGGAASIAVLQDLGLPTDGTVIVDGSGLSHDDRIAPQTLAGLLSAIAGNANPQLWAVGTGSPIAGFTGTLALRFKTSAAKAGAGVVRAKTGTLTTVSGLAGLVRTADGALLAFSFAAPAAKSTVGSEATWDNAAAVLAQCGCSG